MFFIIVVVTAAAVRDQFLRRDIFIDSAFVDILFLIYDFEFDKLGLPRPDAVLFLDVPPSAAVKQVEKRYDGDETKKDIHEKDLSYLEKCYKTATFACDHGYMRRIECLDSDGNVKSVDEIADTIYEIVKKEF